MKRGDIVVQKPPAVAKVPPVNPVARLLPVAMLVAAVGMMAFYFTSGATSRSPMFMFFPVMMLMSVLGTVAYSVRGGSRTAEINQDRQAYLRYLDTLDADVARTGADQHRLLWWAHPEPNVLWSLVGTTRMWNRGRDHDQFCCVRVGLGDVALATPITVPDLDTADELDPVTVGALRRWVNWRSVVADAPSVVSLSEGSVIAVEGDAESSRAVVRAMISELAVRHAPSDLAIAAAVSASARAEWDWLKWLPHHQHAQLVDDAGASRLTYDVVGRVVEDPRRRTVVVADGVEVSPRTGVTVISVDTAEAGSPARMIVDGSEVIVGKLDSVSRSQAVRCARRLAPYRAAVTTAAARPADKGWLELMGIDDPDALDPRRLWKAAHRIRRVPVGVDEQGAAVTVDINEAAHGGMGPHGLCVGATGSGKSEFLRTLALGMITAHPPDVLNLVLVDFKGGATFAGLDRARHVAAVITNLADEADLVARMNDALAGEITRRQELLRAAGAFANITDYDSARAGGADLPPLPALFIIVDEFSELLSQHPEFTELFVTIGRLGRSLGVHLLLASQRLDEGRLRGLETHLSYRICLKSFSASESRAVLGVPDAYHLPSVPGAAYLKTASSEVVRFQTAFVSGRFAARPSTRLTRPACGAAPQVFTAAPVGVVTDEVRTAQRRAGSVRTLFDTVVDRVAGHGSPAHRVWLPPLRTSPTLDDIAPTGLDHRLAAPIGLIDNPYEQRRDPLVVDVSGAAGNVAVVGAPRAGKSTALRTLIQALAESHSPADVAFYCLDFGGGSLSSLRSLPHVGAVAGRHEADLCRRTVAVVESTLRRRAAQGRDGGEVFLVVDGWAALRSEFDALEAPISAIAAQGLSFGVHVVLTASRWAELRPALKDQIGTRIELRLGDPAESEMDRKRARQLSLRPGRGLTRDGREFAVAVTEAPEEQSTRLRNRWPGSYASPIALLPARVAVDELATGPVLGMGEADLASVNLDLGEHPHLIVLGETACGKTSTLRLLCRELMRCNTAEAIRIEIVDFRRTLLGVVESDHLGGYTASPASLATRVASLIRLLQSRMPGEGVTQQQLRARSWWSGPDIYLVIDDYDLVAAVTGNPLAQLADFLPYAKDLGLHVVVARRSGGAARAMFDPVLARLRELGCMGLMMSAGPDEGVLLGSVRPKPLPPGRGTLVVRGQADQLVQVAWSDPL